MVCIVLLQLPPYLMQEWPSMKKIHVLFHDAGGGHRNAAVSLHTVTTEQNRPWQVELIQFQELTDHLDILRKLTGIRIQELYNVLLRNGWTLRATQLLRMLQTTVRLFHGPMVRLLKTYFREHPADLLISVIPHFNRQICEAWSSVYPGRPFVTIITDLADFPPHFWIEPLEEQYVFCGTERAAEQARAMGKDDAHIFLTSGMILRPDFYLPDYDLFIELTTLKQSLVTKKNRKVRRLRELYPDVHLKIFYGRDFRQLLLKYGLRPAAAAQ